MPAPSYPTLFIPRPWASGGAFANIPDTTTAAGRASYTAGFPNETQLPISQGGIAPNRLDFNGAYNILSNLLFWQQSGGLWNYNTTLNYSQPCIVYYGGKMWWCLQANGPDTTGGLQTPGSADTYWEEFIKELEPVAPGGGPNTKQVITTSQTFTAPVDGTYRVTCIGGGGGGGRGGASGAGGSGGGQGQTTSFGSYVSADGGAGGGGGGGLSLTSIRSDGGGGGGGACGKVEWDYISLIQGQIVTIIIGNGGIGGTTTTINNSGGDGSGPSNEIGRGGPGAGHGGGGAIGAGNGGPSNPDSDLVPQGARPSIGGSGSINNTGYGSGGGGGSGADVVNFDSGGAGGNRGGAQTVTNQGGIGGAGTSGAIILEYFVEA